MRKRIHSIVYIVLLKPGKTTKYNVAISACYTVVVYTGRQNNKSNSNNNNNYMNTEDEVSLQSP